MEELTVANGLWKL